MSDRAAFAASSRPASPPSPRRRFGRAVALAVALSATLLLSATLPLVVGCGDSSAEKRKAYQDALAAVDREKKVLGNMRDERERLYGEYLMHEFETRVWSGQFVPHRALGFDWADEFARDQWFARFCYRKMPLGPAGQLDRLLARNPESLPWHDRFAGDAYRRRIADRYLRVLNDLRDRVALQEDRVRNAEEFARILKPKDVD
jgi:hypothetical protein